MKQQLCKPAMHAIKVKGKHLPCSSSQEDRRSISQLHGAKQSRAGLTGLRRMAAPSRTTSLQVSQLSWSFRSACTPLRWAALRQASRYLGAMAAVLSPATGSHTFMDSHTPSGSRSWTSSNAMGPAAHALAV